MEHENTKHGKAVFLELQGSIYEVYRAAVHAVRCGESFQEFVIVDEVEYLSNTVNQLLWSAEGMQKLTKELNCPITGETDGRLNCALLLNGSREEGILLHDTGNGLICASYPVITAEYITRYDEVRRLLDTAAKSAEGIPLFLFEDMRKGKKQLGALLHAITAQM